MSTLSAISSFHSSASTLRKSLSFFRKKSKEHTALKRRKKGKKKPDP
jgi:hypothetical protein